MTLVENLFGLEIWRGGEGREGKGKLEGLKSLPTN